MVAAQVGDHQALLVAEAGQVGVGHQIHGMAMMLGFIDEVPDVVEKRGGFEDAALVRG